MSKKFLWLFSFLLVGSVVYGAVTSDQGIFTTQVITPILQGNSALTIKTPGSNAITFSPNATPAFTLSGAGVANFPLLTATTVPYLDASKNLVSSAATPTQLGFLANATSNLCGINQSCTETNKTFTSPAITTPTGIIKGDVGLGNVDNTSDVTKNAAAVTLTNKTIVGGSNTISGIALTSLTGGTAGGMYYSNGTNPVSLGAGTAGQVPVSAGTTVAWGTPQGGLISDREFITNTALETVITGYTAYADAAGASPVDGTGGAPNSTITWTNSGLVITGLGNAVWTKSGAANRQGEGFSTDFTIGTADLVKIEQIDLDFLVQSGTFVAGSATTDSDMEIWIYNKDTGVLIQPSTFKFYSSSTSVPEHFSATFQTDATSTHYRLIWHTATTSTANYTLRFDNISVHPAKQGPASTYNSLSYNDNSGGSISSAGFGVYKYQTQNYDTAAAYNTTTGLFTAPASGKYKLYASLCTAFQTLVTTGAFDIQFVKNGSTIISRGRTVGSGGSNIYAVATGTDVNLVAGETIQLQAINTSNTTAFTGSPEFNVLTISYVGANSGSAIPNPGVSARAHTVSGASFSSSAAVLNYDVVDLDISNSITTGASWHFTCPVSGNYFMTSSFTNASAALATYQIFLTKNTVTFATNWQVREATNAAALTSMASGVVQCNAGDQLAAYVSGNAGGNITTVLGDNVISIFLIETAAQSTAFVAPTRQTFLSGTAQTYTTPTQPRRPLYLRVRIVGGGGGGAGGNASLNGGAGGNTTFGTSLLTANGGAAGVSNASGSAGGSASLGVGPVGSALTGGSGGASTQDSTGSAGGVGGSSAFGGGGFGGGGSALSAGGAGSPNTGGGGGGAGGGNGFGGSGGGSGGYVDATITSPLATYVYTVGASGTAGGTAGIGGSGQIIVEEFYQ